MTDTSRPTDDWHGQRWPKYATVTDGDWMERGEVLYEGDDIEAANAAALAWPGRCTLVHFGKECRNVRE